MKAIIEVNRRGSVFKAARKQIAHLRHQRIARRRERHMAAGALEQRHAQAALQLRNGLRERRLRHVQALRGSPEVKLLGHSQKLSPHAQIDQRFIHTHSISIQRTTRIGFNGWPSP